MSVKFIPWALLAAVTSAGIGYWAGDSRGYDRGVLETQASRDKARVETLTESIQAVRAEISGSAQANLEIRAAVMALDQRNRTSSKELKHALEKTRSDVVCRFDADVMRILGAGADRADALAAGGTGATLPVGDSPGGQQ